MAKYCIVAPPQISAQLLTLGQLGKHHLLLAHDIVKPEKQELYRQLYHPYGGVHHELIILDNSTAELMKPVEYKMMVQAASIVKPTCIVLPDVYFDTPKTIEESRKAFPWYKDEFFDRGIDIMYLPQGKTPSEFFKCAAAEPMCSSPYIKWWGIPRNIVKHHGSRRKAIELCRALNPYRQIHLFGFSDNLYDDIVCSQAPGVTSIDSAVPVRQQTRFPGPDMIPPRGQWWENAVLTVDNVSNITRARLLFAGEGMIDV